MALTKVSERVWWVGAADWDRRLFDQLIPLPDGTSYNSYLIKGQRAVALIDTVDPSKEEVLLGHLEELGVERIDYIVSNHAEQDHSGAIPKVLERYPGAKVVTNEKCKSFLIDLLHIPEERFLVVGDGEELSLGGLTLKFILTPWVHWPETMVTYLVEEGILFSCDFFGSHLAVLSPFAGEEAKVIEDAKRYYAEIMMPLRSIIKKNMEKLSPLKVRMIAPSHGPVYRNPELIMDAYREWISDEPGNLAVVAYVSMHGSTERMARRLASKLASGGVEVKLFNLAATDTGQLAMALVDAATLVLATPMVLAGAHPLAVYAAYLVKALRPKLKHIAFMGSYGWGGKMKDEVLGLLGGLRAEVLEPLLVRGNPREEDMERVGKLAELILEKHRKLGLLKT